MNSGCKPAEFLRHELAMHKAALQTRASEKVYLFLDCHVVELKFVSTSCNDVSKFFLLFSFIKL